MQHQQGGGAPAGAHLCVGVLAAGAAHLLQELQCPQRRRDRARFAQVPRGVEPLGSRRRQGAASPGGRVRGEPAPQGSPQRGGVLGSQGPRVPGALQRERSISHLNLTKLL